MSDDSARADFERFAAARIGALSRTAYLLTGDAHRAEDLVQDALVQTARNWHRINSNPEGYVRRILYTQNASYWRRRRFRESPLDDHEHGVEAQDSDLRLSLVGALRRLTERQRTILVLRYFEDLTEAQVAAELGITVGTVKSMTRHALMRLRALAPELAELVGAGDVS